jgi:hypothetical protein
MLYMEIMAICSEIHTKHINTLCGQNVELLNVKLVVHIVTNGLCTINDKFIQRVKIKTDVRLLRSLHLIRRIQITSDVLECEGKKNRHKTPKLYFTRDLSYDIFPHRNM